MAYKEAPTEPSLDKDKALVEVRFIGLTWKDYLITREYLNELDLGTECAGVV